MGLYQILRCFVLFVFFAENHTVFSSFTSTPKDITPTKTKILVLKCLPSTEGLTAILAINIKKKEAISDSSSDPGQPFGDNPHKEGQSSTFDSFVRAAISSGNRITVTPTSVR
ncbi:uncharacterized protein LOC131940622 [Physella acuta]|uniref:uncharacterized protein LOC131940622 n=1 Tax=Physella acuta TaxID=109671 RepID=UPI0027DB3C0E|nr:uncharacterized protein LOC131940622 [Physella acuta]